MNKTEMLEMVKFIGMVADITEAMFNAKELVDHE